ncbi:MAG: hypothetical protein ACREEP_17835, partial [Dongiaceae bacterium]
LGRAKRGPEGGGPVMTEKNQKGAGNEIKQQRFFEPDTRGLGPVMTEKNQSSPENGIKLPTFSVPDSREGLAGMTECGHEQDHQRQDHQGPAERPFGATTDVRCAGQLAGRRLSACQPGNLRKT